MADPTGPSGPLETLHYLDRVQERTPEIAAQIVDGLVARTRARRGALVLVEPQGPAGDLKILAAREAGGQALDPAGEDLRERLDALGKGQAVLEAGPSGGTVIPLRAVVREAPEEGARRRRWDTPRVERTLGYVWLEGEELRETGEEDPEVRVASTLGSLLLASAPWLRTTALDPATGLRSPLLLERTLREELRLAREGDIPLTLALLRITEYSELLERLGPAEARRQVSRAGQRLQRSLRRSDLVLRCGGRAFAVLLPAADAEGIGVVRDKLLRAMGSEGGTRPEMGLAQFPAEGETAAELLSAAELSLASGSAGGAATAISVSCRADLDRMLETLDGLGALADAEPGDLETALLRACALASGADRAVVLGGDPGSPRPVASLGEGWAPRLDLVRKALETEEPVIGGGTPSGRPSLLAGSYRAADGSLGVVALEQVGEGFTPGAVSSVGTLLRIGGRMLGDGVALPAAEEPAGGFPGLVGDAPVMRDVYARMRKVLETRLPVLLVGETGTGKELIARAIHDASDRASGPFVTVDCGALPPTLADSELFGHRKGAFTDARSDKQGLIERADGGTLFLDEVASMGPDIQSRLLRFLQEGEVRRVGETDYRQVDVRVVAASNRDPSQEVEEGRLRLDLFHRLQGMLIRVPPLRERREDIPALAFHFLHQFAAQEDREPPRLGSDALAALVAHEWPGNVRELENAVRAGTLVADGRTIHAGDLPEQIRGSGGLDVGPRDVPRTNEEFKQAKEAAVASITREFLRSALASAEGNVSDAARATGLQRTYLHRLLRQYDVDPEEFRS